MITVKDVFEYLNSLFPVNTAADYDNPGILIGDPQSRTDKVLISLDCTLDTVRAAKDNSCDLVVTHHPVIFTPLKNVLGGTAAYELIKSGISVISMHTNMDVGPGGVNDCLCRCIGLKDIKPADTAQGYLLKSGSIETVSPDNFAALLKEKLGGTVKYNCGGRPISRVLVCSGSGGDFISETADGGYDALVTADVKHHEFLAAADSGITIYDAGHFNTEDVVIEPLKEMLQNHFPRGKFVTFHNNVINFA